MTTFLHQTLKAILSENQGDLSNCCLVIPGKRPAIYIKQALSEMKSDSFWLPKIISISEFVEHCTGHQTSDSLDLLLSTYQFLTNEDVSFEESFEDFLLWAPQAFKDFNDVDNYLIDGEALYQNLKNIKEIDEWSYGEELLSEKQLNFNRFWQDLGEKYQKIRSFLLKNELFYPGLLNRYLAENIKDLLSILDGQKLYFIGFNALSKSEKTYFKFLEEAKLAKFFWDADEFYMKDKIQESGLFLRRYENEFEEFNSYESHIRNSAKDIHIHECSSDFTQIKLAGNILESTDYKKVGVFLLDESFLIPVIHSLPKNLEGINVSMGYPMNQHPLSSWVKLVLESIKSIRRSRKDEIHHRELKSLLFHPAVQGVFDAQANKIREEILSKVIVNNTVWLDFKRIMEAFEEHPLIIEYFSFFKAEIYTKGHEIRLYFQKMTDILAQNSEKQIDLEFLKSMSFQLNKLETFQSKYDFLGTAQTAEDLIMRFIAQSELSFVGEPLKGIQITGLLESRTLDFEHVIMIGASEGILPKKKKQNSFIPYELRRYFKLPTHQEQDAIYAYYFYRLLQRSKKLDLLYSMKTEVFGASEPSRYLQQIEHELIDSASNFVHLKHGIPFDKKESSSLEIQSNSSIQNEILSLLKRGVSPSALNTFLRCPLDFYYQYIQGLREENQVEEKIEQSTFGSIVHQVLEDFYKPKLGQVLHENDVKSWLEAAEDKLTLEYSKIFAKSDFQTGYNQLSFQVALKYLNNFLKAELKSVIDLKKENRYLTILELEKAVEANIEIKVWGNTHDIKLKGYIDRVDKVDGLVRIIDYKSGSVKTTDLSTDLKMDAFLKGNKSKALQILMYSFGYAQTEKVNWSQLQPGMISFKNQKEGLILMKKSRGKYSPEFMKELQDFFPELIEGVVTKMLDPNLVFTHSEDAKFCEYCES